MAHVITLSHASDIVLSAGVYAISYTPQNAGRSEMVSETAQLRVIGSSLATMQTGIRNVTRAFDLAKRRYTTGRGSRVYIKLQESGDSDTYRSELLDATIEILDPTMYPNIFGANTAVLKLDWVRRNYWELDAEISLSLTNGGEIDDSGVDVYNIHGASAFDDSTVSFTAATSTIADANDGFGVFAVGDVISLRGSTINDGIYTVATAAAGAITVNEPVSDEAAGDSVTIYDIQNYVHINDSDIIGDLPAACRIEITNSDSDTLETVWIGQNYLSSPLAFAHILEAGDADSDSGSDTADDSSSSGIKRVYALGATNAKVAGWVIPSETLTAADGGYFKVLMRASDSDSLTTAKWQLKVLYSGTIIWQGGQVQFDDTYTARARTIREIDTVQLPPYIPENSSSTDLSLELWAARTGGAINTSIDCLMLMTLDGYRRLRSKDGIVQNSVLIDDGMTGTYYQEVGGEQVRDISAAGEPVLLWPNQDNRIYFHFHTLTANLAPYDHIANVKVYYRPRKVSL